MLKYYQYSLTQREISYLHAAFCALNYFPLTVHSNFSRTLCKGTKKMVKLWLGMSPTAHLCRLTKQQETLGAQQE